MSLSLDTLTTPLTVAEIKAAIYDTIASEGVATTGWKPGAVVRTVIAGVAIVLAAMSSLIALVAKSGFLELSEGDWLTIVAEKIYGTTRSDGTGLGLPVVQHVALLHDGQVTVSSEPGHGTRFAIWLPDPV